MTRGGLFEDKPCSSCNGTGRCSCVDRSTLFKKSQTCVHKHGCCAACEGWGRRRRDRTKLGDLPALKALAERLKNGGG